MGCLAAVRYAATSTGSDRIMRGETVLFFRISDGCFDTSTERFDVLNSEKAMAEWPGTLIDAHVGLCEAPESWK
jgi:hypothetical protein